MQGKVRYTIRLELRKTFALWDYGEGLTYSELEKLMGCDPRKNRHLIHQAAEDVLPDNIVIECKPNIGYFRVRAPDVKGVSERDMKSGAKKNEKALKKATYTDRSQLTREGQQALDHTQFKAAMKVALSNRLERIPLITEKTQVSIPSGKELAEILKGRKEL